MDNRSFFSAHNLTYQLAIGQTLFQNLNISFNEGDKIALVGSNGVGKSTLLKIIAGQIQPSAGDVRCQGSVYYLPQINTLKPETQAKSVFDFLANIADEWWAIAQILETQLNTSLDLSLPIGNLSGGELTKLLLSIGLYRQPSLLLLDEPTNQMDLLALEELKEFLLQWSGAYIIVSHKPFFLDQVVTTTWELSPNGLKVYGGNYSFYQEQKEIEIQSTLRTHEVARKALVKAKEAALQEQKRAARSQREGRLQARDGSMPAIVRGIKKNQAEASAGKALIKHQKNIEQAQQKLEASKIKTRKTSLVVLEEGDINHGKKLIDIQEAILKVDSQILLEDINFQVFFGDRIAISGRNGSGKSSFMKATLGLHSSNSIPSLNSGIIQLAEGLKFIYLDQNYELVNRNKTILENMQEGNLNLNYQLIRQQLGHFLFFNDDVYKLASVLSGGELARLAIAMITVSQIDLVVLDEPTNNLDLETVEQIIEAINEYSGAAIAISHDLEFLSRIRITKAFQLKDKRLQPTGYLPEAKFLYHQELLQSSKI